MELRRKNPVKTPANTNNSNKRYELVCSFRCRMANVGQTLNPSLMDFKICFSCKQSSSVVLLQRLLLLHRSVPARGYHVLWMQAGYLRLGNMCAALQQHC